jgi:hypothetical protein
MVAEPCSRLTRQVSTPFCTASREERTAEIHMPVWSGKLLGNLFGTTAGGFVDGAPPYGNVFKLDTTGKLTVQYNFKGGLTEHFPPEV